MVTLRRRYYYTKSADTKKQEFVMLSFWSVKRDTAKLPLSFKRHFAIDRPKPKLESSSGLRAEWTVMLLAGGRCEGGFRAALGYAGGGGFDL